MREPICFLQYAITFKTVVYRCPRHGAMAKHAIRPAVCARLIHPSLTAHLCMLMYDW